MELSRVDNYAAQARQAQQRFLTYDQAALIAKWNLTYDESYLYLQLFGQPYRLCRASGLLQRQVGDQWADGGYDEIMTALDVLCDSRDDRTLTGNWNGMQNFGLLFHRHLVEQEKDAFALFVDQNPDAFRRTCGAMGGEPISGGDMGYALPVMGELKVALQYWFADEEFLPQVRFFWDENALQYIRYETMYFAVDHWKHLLLTEAKR